MILAIWRSENNLGLGEEGEVGGGGGGGVFAMFLRANRGIMSLSFQ